MGITHVVQRIIDEVSHEHLDSRRRLAVVRDLGGRHGPVVARLPLDLHTTRELHKALPAAPTTLTSGSLSATKFSDVLKLNVPLS